MLAEVDLVALKERMIERQAAVNALWKKGLVGENNAGYLSPRVALTPHQQTVVHAENVDRKMVYEAIAESTANKVKVIGQKRARIIAERADEGLWLQNLDGEWYQKGEERKGEG